MSDTDTNDAPSLDQRAAAPQEVVQDGSKVRQFSLRQQIDYDKYKRAIEQAGTGSVGMQLRRIKSGPAV